MTAKIENLLKITAKLGNSLKSAFKARHFAALFVIYLVAVYPIIRSNFNYIDDMGRVFAGFAGWGYFSRFTSTCLSRFIHTADYLFDISPLAQVLAICILCISGLCAISIIKRGEKTTYWDLIAILPLGLSPYFLECISYKFDSPYMALSILSSIAPLLLYRSNKIIYCAAVLVGMLVMCTTYQAASGIFPMLVMLVSFMMWISKDEYKEIIAFVSASAISYLIGIAIFNLFIMRPVDTYVSNGIASFSEIIEHYKTYLRLVKSDFRKTWQLVALALTVLFVLVNTYKSKQNKFISFLVALAVAAIMFMLSFGLYPILKRPLAAPRAMYGVGAYIAFVSVGGMYSGYSRYASRFLTCVMAWLFIVFSCAYGNALALQKEYENFRITEAIYSLSQLEQFNIEQPKEIELVGNVGHAPAIQNAIRRSAMLRRLVPVMFSPWPPWGYYKFMNYYGLRNVKYAKEAYKGSYEDLALLHESHYHKIYLQDDNKFIIRLQVRGKELPVLEYADVNIECRDEVIQIKKGEPFEVNVTFRCKENESYINSNNYRLSYHIYDINGNAIKWDGARTEFATVTNGKAVALKINELVFSEQGEYILRIDAVQEGVTWLSQKGLDTPEIKIVVR